MKDKNLSYEINANLKSKKYFLCSRNVAEKSFTSYLIFMKQGRCLLFDIVNVCTVLVSKVLTLLIPYLIDFTYKDW